MYNAAAAVGQLAQLEAGATEGRLVSIRKLAEALGVAPEELL